MNNDVLETKLVLLEWKNKLLRSVLQNKQKITESVSYQNLELLKLGNSFINSNDKSLFQEPDNSNMHQKIKNYAKKNKK